MDSSRRLIPINLDDPVKRIAEAILQEGFPDKDIREGIRGLRIMFEGLFDEAWPPVKRVMYSLEASDEGMDKVRKALSLELWNMTVACLLGSGFQVVERVEPTNGVLRKETQS